MKVKTIPVVKFLACKDWANGKQVEDGREQGWRDKHFDGQVFHAFEAASRLKKCIKVSPTPKSMQYSDTDICFEKIC